MQSLLLRRAALLGLVVAFGTLFAVAPTSAQRSVPRGPGRQNNPQATPGTVDITGTITAVGMGGGTVEITTDHGTAVTLTVNASTRLQIGGSGTAAAANLAVGQQAEAIYRPADKTALALAAAAPQAGTVFGAITALDPTGGTLQITPLVGSPQTVKLTAQTQFALNGRLIASDSLAVGQLATLRLASDGSASTVAAETPPLVNLAGTITALDTMGGTLQVTTQSATSITLQVAPSIPVQLNNAASTVAMLAVGDPVVVQYEYRLLPGTSRALAIVARSAAPATTPTPGTTPTPTPGTTPTPTPAAAALSVSLNPTSVKGGTTATGTITLGTAAPANGAVVTLASSNPAAASVLGSVTVTAGATTAAFTVTTTAVTANATATIFATYGGAIGMAVLTITP